MRTLVALAVAAAAWLVPGAASACDCCRHHPRHAAAAPGGSPAGAQLAPGEARVRIPIAGMRCGHCVSRVEAALARLDGVKRADASLDDGEAVVVIEKAKVTTSKLVDAIEGLGFKAGAPVPN